MSFKGWFGGGLCFKGWFAASWLTRISLRKAPTAYLSSGVYCGWVCAIIAAFFVLHFLSGVGKHIQVNGWDVES